MLAKCVVAPVIVHQELMCMFSVLPQGLPATDVSTLLMSPSVFSQSKPQPPHGAAELSTTQTPLLPQPPPPPRPEEPWALSRSQLQATLIHLIQVSTPHTHTPPFHTWHR